VLPPYKKLLFPSLTLPDDDPGLADLGVGFVEDLVLLMNRLGDVHVVALAQDPERPKARRAARKEALTPEAIDRMLAAESADFVVTGNLFVLSDSYMGTLNLRGPGGQIIWSDPLELMDGMVREARIVLAANLIQAATGRRKDVRRVRLGGSQSLRAYGKLCLARFHALAPQTRQAHLEEALRLDPAFAEAKLLLAETLQGLGREKRARELLSQVVRSFPRLSWARLRLGVALSVTGFPERAVEEVQAALDSDPDGLTLFHAGLFADAQGDQGTAQTLYERAVERGCLDPLLCEKLGRIRANGGEHAAAIELWERARDLDRDYDHVLGNLALAEHHLGHDEAAEDLFKQALLLAPNSFTTHASRAVWLQDGGRHDDAITACNRGLRIRPDSPLLFNNRGISKLAVGDSRGAREDFEEALRLQPDGELAAFVRANLARLSHGTARVDEALRLLSAGAEFVQDERPRRAVPLLLEALDLYPDSWEGWLFLALAYRQQLQWEQMADALAQVVRLNPGYAEAFSERSLALLALGRGEEALDHARMAVDLSPDEPGLHANLGLVHMEAGAYEAAQSAFDRAASLDPSDPLVERCLKELKKQRRKSPHWGQEAWS